MRRFYIPFLLLLTSITTNAQQNMGIGTSNWGGVNSMYLNPANIGGSRQSAVLEILSLNLTVDNNFGTIDASNGIGDIIARTAGGSEHNSAKTAIVGNSSGSFDMLAPVAEVHGPGFIVPINAKNSIAITTRIRAFSQFSGFSSELYNVLNNNNYIPEAANAKFKWTSQLWSEINLAYGTVLLQTPKSTLKAGVTARFLGGVSYYYLNGSMNINTNKDSLFTASDASVRFSTNQTTNSSEFVQGLNSNLLNDFVSAKGGRGFGGDIGIVYEFQPNPEVPKPDSLRRGALKEDTWKPYKLRFSASILDLGSILYSNVSNNNLSISGSGLLTGADIGKNIPNIVNLKSYLLNQGLSADSSNSSLRFYMPTRLLISVDYNIYNDFYFNAAYQGNMASVDHVGNYLFNSWFFTPRFDNKYITVALPITYSTLANDVKLGLAFRAGGLYLGSNDMLGFFGKAHGFNAYFGLHVALNKKLSKN